MYHDRAEEAGELRGTPNEVLQDVRGDSLLDEDDAPEPLLEGLGLRFWVLGFGVQGYRCGVQGLWLEDLEFRVQVWGLWLRVEGLRCTPSACILLACTLRSSPARRSYW